MRIHWNIFYIQYLTIDKHNIIIFKRYFIGYISPESLLIATLWPKNWTWRILKTSQGIYSTLNHDDIKTWCHNIYVENNSYLICDIFNIMFAYIFVLPIFALQIFLRYFVKRKFNILRFLLKSKFVVRFIVIRAAALFSCHLMLHDQTLWEFEIITGKSAEILISRYLSII